MPRDRTPKWKVPVYFAGSVFLLYLLLSLTGILQFYAAPSAANEPEIKLNSSLLTTIFKKPAHNDFMVYVNRQPNVHLEEDDEYSVHRVCGLSGDTVVIKDGVLFVNGVNVDEKLQLKHHYRVSGITYSDLQNHGNNLFSSQSSASVEGTTVEEDSFDVFLADNVVKSSAMGRRLIMPVDFVDDAIKQKHNKPWNQDQFGPVVVPANTYFVLGDNRNASADSRYIGFVPAKDWKRTVLSH